MAKCILYGYFENSANDPLSNATVRAILERPYLAGSYFRVQTLMTALTNASGYVELTVGETETGSQQVSIELIYIDSGTSRTVFFKPITVKNQASLDLRTVLEVK